MESKEHSKANHTWQLQLYSMPHVHVENTDDV